MFVAVIIRGEKGRATIKYTIHQRDYSFGYFTGNTLRIALNMTKRSLYTSAIGKKSLSTMSTSKGISNGVSSFQVLARNTSFLLITKLQMFHSQAIR